MHFDERMGFIEYETEKEALEKVNKLMIEGRNQ
jgi:hypothetical protein